MVVGLPQSLCKRGLQTGARQIAFLKKVCILVGLKKPNDEYKLDSNNQAKNKERSDTPGNWNVYKNNKLIRTIKGDEDPQQ
jgi:hypothetical protein